jgi:eukaryotic-like serine/threonine-protein kinase
MQTGYQRTLPSDVGCAGEGCPLPTPSSFCMRTTLWNHDAMLAPPVCPNLDAVFPPGGALAGRLFSRILGDAADEAPLPSGTRIGCWRIDKLLGRGGSSTVYLADRDDGHFDQQAALKIVRPNRELIEQFLRERQILADLRHPGIARLIDGGQIENGRPWFAMEPVFGERIDDYVRNRRLPLRERITLFEDVCEAVAYAHSRTLIHADIKPGNLLVDETGRPRLLDFGIAGAGDRDEDGYRAMTPIYASPEQRAGASVTAASDVYQLGRLLQMLVMPRGEACPTLPRKPRAALMDELTTIVTRATAKEPAERYPNVSALQGHSAAVRMRRTRSRSVAPL